MPIMQQTTAGEMAAILRAKATNQERFTKEERLILLNAARMIERLANLT